MIRKPGSPAPANTRAAGGNTGASGTRSMARAKCPRRECWAARRIPRAIPRPGATFTSDEHNPRSNTSRSMASTCASRPSKAARRRPAAAAVQRHRRQSRVVLSVHGGDAGQGDRHLRRARRRPLADELAPAPLLRTRAARSANCSTASATAGGCHRRFLGRRARAAVRAAVSGSLPATGARGDFAGRDHGARGGHRRCRR